MKEILLAIAVILIGIGMILNFIVDLHQPTRSEVKAMIEGDTLSIFHINNAGQLQSCLYTLILIELNEIEGLELRQKLEKYVKLMVAMEGLRSKRARDKFKGER